MNDLIDRQAAIDVLDRNHILGQGLLNDTLDHIADAIMALPSAHPDIIRCKDCNKASKCYGDVVMRSRGGGNIYCPLEFCSEAERRTDEAD